MPCKGAPGRIDDVLERVREPRQPARVLEAPGLALDDAQRQPVLPCDDQLEAQLPLLAQQRRQAAAQRDLNEAAGNRQRRRHWRAGAQEDAPDDQNDGDRPDLLDRGLRPVENSHQRVSGAKQRLGRRNIKPSPAAQLPPFWLRAERRMKVRSHGSTHADQTSRPT
jgi:hypothetical protein